jgi:hypothetical protein
MIVDIKPRLKGWSETMGLEPEEALALLLFMVDMGAMHKNDPEIKSLEELIGNQQVEKMLAEEQSE